mgnify:CR=1 FL=1
MIPRRLTFPILAGVALVALALNAPAIAQTASSFFNLNTSVTKAQAIVTTACHPTATTVACPADTKTQLHYLRGGGTVYLGLDPATSSANGLPLAGDARQAWDVGGPLVKCATAPDAGVTLYTVCGRGN